MPPKEAESTIAYLKDYSDVVRIVDAEALRVAEDEGLSKCHSYTAHHINVTGCIPFNNDIYYIQPHIFLPQSIPQHLSIMAGIGSSVKPFGYNLQDIQPPSTAELLLIQSTY